MDALPVEGWIRTASANNPVTDSAAGATALATGVKTNNMMIGLDPESNLLTTILEHAQSEGMAVGLVTTTKITHATPAAFASHVPDRRMMTEIAAQFLSREVDVLMGGGEDEFLPATATGCYPESGERNDSRNLIDEAISAGYVYVCSATALNQVDSTSVSRLLGLFADEDMTHPFTPSLAEMTQKAVTILSKDQDGFFLMVEGGHIDSAGHANDAASAINNTLHFDGAVSVARAYASIFPSTLVIVTADHETGGMSVSLEPEGGPGEDGPFFMPDGTPFYVNWTTTAHTAADVPVTAEGPDSQFLLGTHENTYIYQVIFRAYFLGHDIFLPLVPR
jgi:alkaline phosphatase